MLLEFIERRLNLKEVFKCLLFFLDFYVSKLLRNSLKAQLILPTRSL